MGDPKKGRADQQQPTMLRGGGAAAVRLRLAREREEQRGIAQRGVIDRARRREEQLARASPRQPEGTTPIVIYTEPGTQFASPPQPAQHGAMPERYAPPPFSREFERSARAQRVQELTPRRPRASSTPPRTESADTTPVAPHERPATVQPPIPDRVTEASVSPVAPSVARPQASPPSLEELHRRLAVNQAQIDSLHQSIRGTTDRTEESSRLSGQRSMRGGLTRSGIAQERRRIIEAREAELREALRLAQAAVLTQRMRGLVGIPVPRALSLQFWGGFGDAVGAEHIPGLVEMLVPLIPFAGVLIDAIEATSGRSWLLQERLSVDDRAMAGGGVALTLIPLAGRIVRAGRTGTEITARIARRLGRTDETLSEVLRRLARIHSAPHVVEEALRRALAHEPLTGAHIQALEEFIHALEPLATTRRLSRPSIRALARGVHRGWEIIEGVRRFNTTALFSKLERLWSRGRHSVYLTRANQLVGTHESLLAFRRAHPEYAGWHSHHVIEEVHLSNLGVRNNFPGRGELPCVLLPPRQHSQRLRSMLGQLDSLQPSSARELYMDYGRVYRLLLDDYSGGTGTAQELVDIVADMLEIDLVHR